MVFVWSQLIFLGHTVLLTLIAPSDQFTPTDWIYKTIPMAYVDGFCRDPETRNYDTFFDRVVSISILLNNKTGPKMYENVVTAVLITQVLVLTSYNAFRKVSQEDDSFHGLYFTMLNTRGMNNGSVVFYRPISQTQNQPKIVCARELIPNMFNIKFPSHMQHGMHNPRHDLMVMRLNSPINFLKPVPESQFDLNYTKNSAYDEGLNGYGLSVGPILSKLAETKDVFESTFQFASIGYINDEHIEESRYLESERYTIYDNVIVDCDEWIPREWGYFICISNTRDFRGIASGAVLYSGEKLFGIGSFALWKGKAGILVFTDVRPYTSLIFNTCTKEDQNPK